MELSDITPRMPQTPTTSSVNPAENASAALSPSLPTQGDNQLQAHQPLRVAAYCRISSSDESKPTSYTAQHALYTARIQSRPGWSFAGIYVDDEACFDAKRSCGKEFNRMLKDAEAGRIDCIVTRSISCFGRNTLDTLECVRRLRQLSPPIGVIFEKEQIDTLDAAGEQVLATLFSMAQRESRLISDNIRRAFQKNFQSGRPHINLNRMLGYDRGENGEWVINEEQAKVVRFIFEKYVSGNSANKIAQMANVSGMRTVNNKEWSADSVLDILRNEKYVGDLEMQKTVTKDLFTHKAAANNGEAPKYYVMDHHEGIVDRHIWDKVQMLLCSGKKGVNSEKKRAGGTVPSPFGNLICGAIVETDGKIRECNSPLFRLTYTATATGYSDERSRGFDPETQQERYTFQYPVWRCRRKQGAGGKNAQQINAVAMRPVCASALVWECALEQSFMEMLYELKEDYAVRRDASFLVTEFRKACEEACKQLPESVGSVQHGKDAADLMKRSGYCDKESTAPESEQSLITVMQRNFDFFLRCLLELPEENSAGMKMNINHPDPDGSKFREEYGKEGAGFLSNVSMRHGKKTAGNLAQVPDYLKFERGIYGAFIQNGKVYGDRVVYETNFGVKLNSSGNSRTLSSFIGFRRCHDDGSVELLDETWKVCGKSISYRRKERGQRRELDMESYEEKKGTVQE